jgi:TRAP-type C4-dicarboxylate transport system substrate-binding protein
MAMKRKSSILSILVIAGVLFGLFVFVGCGGGPSDSGNSDGSSASTDAGGDGSSAVAPRILKINSYLTEGSPITDGLKVAVDAVSEESNGELVGEGYYNGTLLGFDDSWEGCANGTVDIAHIPQAVIGQYSQLMDILSVPIKNLPETGGWTISQAFNEFVRSRSEFDEELTRQNLKLIILEAVPGNNFHSAKRTLNVPSDAKGLVIEALGSISSEFLGSLGANTVTLDFGDYLVSAQRGVVDTFFNQWGAMGTSQTLEVLKYHTIFGDNSQFPGGSGLAASAMMYVCNLDTWNSLTESQQEALIRAFEKGVKAADDIDLPHIQESYEMCVDRGDEFNIITDPAILQQWYDAAQPAIDEWKENVTKLGCDADSILADFETILEKYE